jgi:peroxiredoxin Q/BCP
MQEASDFRDEIARFDALGVQVLGISADSVATQKRFREKLGLPFPLLSDPDRKVCEAYGVLVEKTRGGRKSVGIERSTFLVDEEGRVRRIWRKVKVKDHVREVVEAIRGE